MGKDIKVLGIDLAKNIFQVHGVNKDGKCQLKKRLKTSELKHFLFNHPACIVAMEACGSAHYWGRLSESYGHTVRLMAPQYVKPYVKSNKNDANDADGIAEAASRENMRFVGLKTVEQQTQLSFHKARELVQKHRTAQANQIRGLLSEYGLTLPLGIKNLSKMPMLLSEYEAVLGGQLVSLFTRLYDMYKRLDEEVTYYDKKIEASVKECAISQELLKIDGIGVMTASAVITTIGDASKFKNGREVAAWLGLTPKQCSSGDKTRLLGISKRGDNYVRKLLIHGARAALRVAKSKNDKKSRWVVKLMERTNFNKAAVALANKHARIIWAIMSSAECYDENHAAAQYKNSYLG